MLCKWRSLGTALSIGWGVKASQLDLLFLTHCPWLTEVDCNLELPINLNASVACTTNIVDN